MTENQFRKIVQGICIGAVTVFFIMLVVLVILWSQEAEKKGKNENLQREIDRAVHAAEDLQGDIDRYKLDEYISAYAREELGMIEKGKTIFTPR
jgi:cell division protein FtsB